ncbi:PPC domain-containing DNA-binding protein [Luedemannella helvata]|uniref:PPC domain-containing protein n=1 Tax=Luedemannella helvata TaxID=349315 RepID=A0ABP4W0Q0_9ACTN
MRSRELTLGRTFAVVFDHGEDFMTALSEFCAANDVRQGYVPGFLGAYSSADLVATCEAPADPVAPVWTRLQVEYVEAIGCATLAWDPDAGRVVPHVHLATGVKRYAAAGHTSHLLGATVQFVNELLVFEVVAPQLRRPPRPDLYDIPVLTLED